MNLNSTKYRIAILLALLTAILPYLYISFYCNPIADDFTYAFTGKTQALLPTLIDEYLTSNGRYISNIFVLLNPIAFDSYIGYKITPIFILLIAFFSIHYCLKALMNSILGQYELFVLSLAATLLYLHQMPIISEGIYWYTGAVTYQLGSSFVLLYAGTLYRYNDKKYIFRHKTAHIIVLILLLFLAIGFNEIIMLTMLLFSLGIFIIFRLNNLEGRKFISYLFIVSICFSCLVYFAPGNSIREAYFPDNHKFLHSLISSLAQCIRFFFEWISSAALILMSLLYYALNKRLSEQIPIFRKSFYLTPAISFTLLFAVIFIGAFPAYWSTGILGQHRTMNISYFLFIIAWFINLTVIYNRNFAFLEFKSEKLKVALCLLIGCSLVFTKNGYDILEDIRTGDITRYNEQMTERYSLINNSDGIVYFEPIKNRPKSLFVLDITDNPNNWQNKGYAIYFERPDTPIMLKPKLER